MLDNRRAMKDLRVSYWIGLGPTNCTCGWRGRRARQVEGEKKGGRTRLWSLKTPGVREGTVSATSTSKLRSNSNFFCKIQTIGGRRGGRR